MENTGWVLASSVASTGSGSQPWTTKNNIKTLNGAYAVASLEGGTDDSEDLEATGFGLASLIPWDATIVGIEIEVTRIATIINDTGSTPSVFDKTIQLLNVTGSNKANAGINWSTNQVATVTYGGKRDKHGLDDISTGDVRSSSFGARVTVDSSRTGGLPANIDAKVDAVRIRVHFVQSNQTVEDMGPCDCCEAGTATIVGTGTGTGGACDTGTCTWEWDGSDWNNVAEDCVPNGTPVPGDPGCTYSSCVCLPPTNDGEFVGQQVLSCCSCNVICLL